jgi:hypothetical protein
VIPFDLIIRPSSLPGRGPAWAARFARVFLGLTPGWYGGREPVSPEDLAAHMETVMDTGGFKLPKTGMDEVEVILEMLKEQ